MIDAVHAFRPTLTAGRLAERMSVDQALHQLLCTARPWPVAVPGLRITRAVHRCGRLAAQLGSLNSCLSRSLAIAALAANRKRVQLFIGFRADAASARSILGHAWVTVDGRNLSDPPGSAVNTSIYAISRSFPISSR